MNLSGERNRQKLSEALELMGLSEKNQKLAENYLDPDRGEERELLLEAEPQDFSGLDDNAKGKCRNYVNHCMKRDRKEEFGRFVRFCAAAGGSTAYYVLVNYGWNLNRILEYLSREQAAAIQAEGIVWNVYGIKNVQSGLEQKSPEVLREAMKLCYHKSDNAKVLLAALSLHYTKPAGNTGAVMAPGSGAQDEGQIRVRETADFLERNLLDSMDNLFTGMAPSDEELGRMKEFVRRASVTEPFPQELYTVLRGKSVSNYLLTMLAASAFLAVEHSPLFGSFVRLAIAMDHLQKKTSVLEMCLHVGGTSWFFSHIRELEDGMPMPREDYMVWCLKNCKYGSPVKRIVKDHPEVVRSLISKVTSEEYQHLLAMTKDMNPMLYRELSSLGSGEFRRKLSEELTGHYTKGRAEAVRYLLGEDELDVLYPFVKEWRGVWDYGTHRCQKIHALKKNGQEDQMYRRAVVLEGLCMRAMYFTSYWHGKYKKIDRGTIGEIVEVFEQEHLPVSYQLEAFSSIYDSFYSEKDKTGFINECVMVMRLKKKEWSGDFVRLSREGNAVVRILCIRMMEMYWQEYREALLACAVDSAKQVRELLAAVYEGIKDLEPEIRNMLSSRRSQEREMAVQVLKRWGVQDYQAELKEAYEKEKSRKIKELLADCLGLETETDGEQKEHTAGTLVREVLKGGKKRKLSWVYEGEASFPQVNRKDGTPAAEDHVAAVLVCYADMSVPGFSREAGILAEDLDPEGLSLYVGMLFDRWMETGAEAKKKWVLYAASIHGGERIIPVLHAQIQEWPKVSRGAMAAEAVKALALNGSSNALLLVDQISRKFKFRQVKNAASEALSYAAEQLGITKEELEDRIVPSLGFDEKMEQVFDYGTRSFRVALTPALGLEVYDENGKRLKNLPAPGRKDEPEKAKAASDAWKLLKKQLKTVVANQTLRLEQALSAERLWEVSKWQELFVKNPVMHQFATGLIWGRYEDGELKDTFCYMEDGSFNTVEEEEYEMPADGRIGLVHPIELEEDVLSAWKEQLADYEVIQPMEQLDRPFCRPTEEEREQTELTRFGGKLLNGLSLSGKLQNMGWYRGSVQDAGGYYTFYREDQGLGVELEFSGCYVGDENEEVTVYGAQFYRAGTVKRGSYVYDTIKPEHLYRLGEVSPRYFSEIVLQLTKATASSQEQLSYPECRERG